MGKRRRNKTEEKRTSVLRMFSGCSGAFFIGDIQLSGTRSNYINREFTFPRVITREWRKDMTGRAIENLARSEAVLT